MRVHTETIPQQKPFSFTAPIAIFCTLLLLSMVGQLSAQQTFQGSLSSFVAEQKQEKIYLHIDKPQYATGEYIWLKAYVTNATTHLPSQVSSTLHVELINEEKAIIDSLTLFVSEGVSQGSFLLSRKLAPGKYRIRAYTAWMRNFDRDFFFRKDVQIIDGSQEENGGKDAEKVIDAQDQLLLDVLPEGGDLIDGIPTKVALKAADTYGRGIEVSGVIVNDEGKQITTFKSNSLGYAVCLVKPHFGESYLAIVEQDTFQLPSVKRSGASLRVINRYRSDDIHIAVLSTNIDLRGGSIVLHNKGRFLFSQECKEKNSFATRLKKNQLGSGIVHITFFDKNQIPLTERLVFPNPPSNEKEVDIQPNKSSYKKRSKVTLKLESESNPIHSASITINPVSESSYDQYEANIENYLLLSSDLKGKINSPDFYFSGTKEAHKALDLLLLTHGWSRFNWESLLGESFTPSHLAESGLTIYGKVSSLADGLPKEDTHLQVTIPSIGVLGDTLWFSEDGTFQLLSPSLMDSTSIYIQALRGKEDKLKKNRAVKIELSNQPREEETAAFLLDGQVKPAFKEKKKKLDQISKAFFLDPEAIQLDEVVISEQRYSNTAMEGRTFYLKPSNRLILDSLDLGATAFTVFDLLRRVPGLTIRGSIDQPSVLIRGASSFSQIGSFASVSGEEEPVQQTTSPAYFLDGVPIENFEASFIIASIPISDIEFIDVLKGAEAAKLGSRGQNGAILIYTKRGAQPAEDRESPGVLAFTHPGYHKAKEFYSPNYAEPNEKHEIPDFRTTLHWEPEVEFDGKQAEISFFTSDQTGVFQVRMEGISTDGNPIFEEGTIYVE